MSAPRMPSTAVHRFDMAPSVKMPRSRFDLSKGRKMTFDSGYLYPAMAPLEIYPGDTISFKPSFFARLSTPLKPVMDNIYLQWFAFFVPNRLVWTNWEKLLGAQNNPGDSISYITPTIPLAAGGAAVGTLHDYFGLPSGAQITAGFNVNALPSRGYQKIWNEWFRDENMQNSVTVDTGDGPDVLANYALRKRGKRPDYFTTALPWTQKSTSPVTIPAGSTTAPVNLVPFTTSTNPMKMRLASTDAIVANDTGMSVYGASTAGAIGKDATTAGHVIDPNGRLIADISGAYSVTINALRLAEATQALLERDARGGTRLVELIKSHWGVTNPDFRLQRSELLGGGRTNINIHPVPLTNKGDGTTPGAQGNLAAFGTAMMNNGGFVKSFTEHGFIHLLVCAYADLTYQQGVDLLWTRSTRYDYYVPSFAHLGEQAITTGEIYKTGAAGDAVVFGYTERWNELRYGKSDIVGKFRSDYATPLDSYHLSQRFTAAPVLGDTFITETPPISRIVAVTSEPQFIMDSWYDIKAARILPVYGIPSMTLRL
ncbi:MAG: major capsid protein [Microvirus sp.]|nr:MAG: major capsid protein [Microvirus sp.]